VNAKRRLLIHHLTLDHLQMINQRGQRYLRLFELTLPNGENIPPAPTQALQRFPIPINIGFEFCSPEIYTRLGHDSVSAANVTMPKTSMDKNTDLQSRQYNVRFSRQILLVKSESVALGVQKTSDHQFGLGVLTLDARHHARSRGPVNDVHFVPPQNSVVS
jgi:hypothetical protein